MLRGLPVLAADTGGPVETVVEGETGWLRDAGDAAAWTAVMERALHGLPAAERAAMARAAARRVRDGFGQDRMAERLDAVLDGLLDAAPAPGAGRAELWIGVAAVALATTLWGALAAAVLFWLFGSAGDGGRVVWAER